MRVFLLFMGIYLFATAGKGPGPKKVAALPPTTAADLPE